MSTQNLSYSFHGRIRHEQFCLAKLNGSDEQIRIPGLYEGSKPPSTRDRELFKVLLEAAEEDKSRYGVKEFIK